MRRRLEGTDWLFVAAAVALVAGIAAVVWYA